MFKNNINNIINKNLFKNINNGILKSLSNKIKKKIKKLINNKKILIDDCKIFIKECFIGIVNILKLINREMHYNGCLNIILSLCNIIEIKYNLNNIFNKCINDDLLNYKLCISNIVLKQLFKYFLISRYCVELYYFYISYQDIKYELNINKQLIKYSYIEIK